MLNTFFCYSSRHINTLAHLYVCTSLLLSASYISMKKVMALFQMTSQSGVSWHFHGSWALEKLTTWWLISCASSLLLWPQLLQSRQLKQSSPRSVLTDWLNSEFSLLSHKIIWSTLNPSPFFLNVLDMETVSPTLLCFSYFPLVFCFRFPLSKNQQIQIPFPICSHFSAEFILWVTNLWFQSLYPQQSYLFT